MINDITPSWVVVTRVLICDERPTARAALTRVLSEAIPTVTDVDSSTDGADLVAQFASRPADLVLVGIRSGKSRGVDAVNQLLDAYPAAPVIVYGSVDDTRAIATAIERGARGFPVVGRQ